MQLKYLEKIKLIKTALMLGIPLGMILFTRNTEAAAQAETWQEALKNYSTPDNFGLYTTLAAIPSLTDSLITARLEPTT